MKVSHESSIERKKLNIIKTKDILENIKSRFILKKLFNYLNKKKSIVIIKYNKNMQKRIEIKLMIIKNYQK